MKTLILTRHAKSSWTHPGPDHDRPLNDRGRRSATAIGDWLRTKGYVPDQVLSSSSQRTRETYDLLGFPISPDWQRQLYLADPMTMFAALRHAKGDTVLMLGHNPGIAFFAEQLLASPPDHSRFDDYPTCATLIARFNIATWAEVTPNCGTAVDFVIPRELTD